MTRSRRRFEDEDKLAVVRRHLIDKVSVSDLCDAESSADADLHLAKAVV